MTKSFQSIHFNHSIPDLSNAFDITCEAKTDVWEKPPSTHSFNAPIIYQSTTVSSFRSAKVTVSAEWKHKYDQGGLALIINSKDRRRWVKTGIEYLNDQPNVSTVGTDTWSDWSLTPLPSGGPGATIELENASDGSLWVWLLAENGTRIPLREIAWWGDVDKDAECWIGVYAAKPAPHGEIDELKVHFQNLSIQTD